MKRKNDVKLKKEVATRKQSKDTLVESEDRFKYFFDNSIVGQSLTLFSGEIHTNKAFSDMLGYTQAQFKNKKLQDITHPDDIELTQGEMEQLISGKRESTRFNKRFLRKDGTILWVDLSSSLRRDKEGKPLYLMTSIIDITQRKQSEEALKQSEEKFRLLFMTGLDAAYIATLEDGLIIETNENFEIIFGYSRDEAIGKTSLQLNLYYDPDDRARMVSMLKTKGAVRDLELKGRKKSGEIIVISLSVSIMPVQNEPHIFGVIRDITDRKHAAELLQQSEARYRSLIENQTEVIARSDLSGVLTFVNEAYCRTFGKSQEELVGSSFTPRVLAEDLPISLQAIKTIQSPPYRTTIKTRHLTPHGVRWIEWENSAVLDSQNKIIELQGTGRDITERKQAEEALFQSNEKFKAQYKGIPIPTYTWQKVVDDLVLADYNESAFEFTKGRIVNLIGKTASSVYKDDAETLNQLMECARTKKNSRTERWHHLASVDESKYLVINYAFVPPDLVMVHTEDFTERKRAEEEEAAHVLFEKMLADVQTSFLVGASDEFDKLIIHAQRQLCEALGTDRSSLWVGTSEEPRLLKLTHLCTLDEIPPVPEGVTTNAEFPWFTSQLLEGKIVAISDLDNLPMEATVDRERLLYYGDKSTLALPFTFGEPRVFGALSFAATIKPVIWSESMLTHCRMIAQVLSSVLVKKRAEDEIRQLNASLEMRVQERTAELVRANHTKDEFLANMSHELRTPLNGILGFSESLIEGVRGPLTELQKGAVDLIRSSGEHLLELINDILDVSKIEAGKFEIHPEVVEVNEICKSSLAFVKELAYKKSIEVEYLPAPLTSKILVDPKRLKQILVNLLNNAVKFTPEMGKVTLRVLVDEEEDQMYFSVTDTGVGISADDLQKLFKPFVQLDSSLSRQYEGSGLGLMLARQLAEIHGGTLKVKSEVGKGSSFTVTLPWQQNIVQVDDSGLFVVENERENDSSSSLMSTSEAGIKILLVEDNESNVMLAKDYLESRGYQIFVAHDGVEALVKANEISPALILMDIQMPEMNGFEATRRLRVMPGFASVPIIALTALAMRGDRERCLEAGMDDYLSKPVKLKVLEQRIEELLHHP